MTVGVWVFLVLFLVLGACEKNKGADSVDRNELAASLSNGDYAKAIPGLTTLSNAGDPSASMLLGYLYHKGFGVSADQSKAFSLYKKSAVEEYPRGIQALALFYSEQELDEQKCKNIIELFEKASLLGLGEAYFYLAKNYRDGFCVVKSNPKWIEYLNKCVKNNNQFSEMCATDLLYEQQVSSQEYEELEKKYLDLIENQLPDAAFMLSKLYLYRIGDCDKGIQHLKAESSKGYDVARSYLAYEYYTGKCVPKDFAKAYELASKSEAGVANSAYLLGLSHSTGSGVERNDATATMFFDEARKRGSDEYNN